MIPIKTLPENKSNKVWNAERVTECLRALDLGQTIPGGTPFFENRVEFRASDIVYDYSEEEIREIGKCAADVVYFANKYAVAMTDRGVKKIQLRPYQKKVLQDYQKHRFNAFLSSRQVGKCFFRQSIISLKHKKFNSELQIPFGIFFFECLKKKRKLTFSEHFIFLLLKIEAILTHGKVYKLHEKELEEQHS